MDAPTTRRDDESPRSPAAVAHEASADGGPIARGTALGRWIGEHPRESWYWGASVVAAALYAVAAPVDAVTYGIPVLAAMILPLVQSLAIVGVLRFPWFSIAAFSVAGGATALWGAPDWLPWPWPVTTIIGFVALTGATWAFHGWRRGIAAFLIPAVLVTVPIVSSFSPRSLPSPIVALSLGLVAAGLGALLSDRIRIAGQLTAERAVSEAETERRLVAEERQRIARELHDVVAHGLSLIQVQATSAPYRVPGVEPHVAAEFDDIARAARESLGEMRRLLGALRGDERAVEHAPQPTLADVGALVGESQRAGAEVRLAMPAVPAVPAAVGIAAYRIVQEGVSNAVRHAPGTGIDVAVGVAGGALLVEVENDAPTHPSPSRGSGHGLVGMRERATLLGGSLEAGPTATGGFRVTAVLPLDGQRTPGGEGDR